MYSPPSLVSAGATACERLGYEVSRPADAGGPPAVATPTSAARPLPRARPDDARPVAVEPLAPPDVTPTMLVSRLWNDARHDRLALFVVPADAAADALSVLRPPALLRGVDDDGLRRFYSGPDRVPLDEGGFAAVKSVRPDLRWAEEPASGPLGDRHDESARRLVLRDGTEPVAVLDGVDGLSCPPARTFPYTYRRGDDRRFHVRRADGTPAGRFDTVAAMRRAAYHPVPMPLVPEHVLPAGTRASDAWLVLAVDDAADPLAGATLHGPVGEVSLEDVAGADVDADADADADAGPNASERDD